MSKYNDLNNRLKYSFGDKVMARIEANTGVDTR
jgi:hypothetical protein